MIFKKHLEDQKKMLTKRFEDERRHWQNLKKQKTKMKSSEKNMPKYWQIKTLAKYFEVK